ncbi:carbohydrate ABC transporter permease [Verminephrobacter eiseniae]|uniref:carbohydrate ABC transporter permease n=1 Tax=Verminephrobacter eiseniae TaxID=364317 RepID=UPI0022381361|nr:carbohydrate ABC transporter permease [Verminephrobacter eiseniae]MCW5231313.1 carbohydrate ABC transporter permease [Verminephrobacter eiseniae]MCW5259547.1 carbohydrate ABC transporter permease [Verminephrobacter eiseniae]MCW5293045.1 carbohydrate ABC transporter permease [Verminephrobacter eiseniae]MCW8184438.1 carbohydrate ABC transporter permease [Verminephrobacter eiseniae]MCW8221438.1 carbohydrate ABC transporter permease [Verminephrobacter eiseniae]
MNIVGNNLADRLVLAAVIALAIVWVAPLMWVFALSFKPNEFLTQRTDVIFSGPFTLKNYIDIIGTSAVFRWIVNSIIVALSQTLAMLVLASLAGYGFARTEFPGKNVLFVLVLAGLAVPEQAIIVPLHLMFADLEMHNTYTALILPRLAMPFGVYLMTQYFKAIPRDIEEAALLDNASRLKIFFRVLLPLSIPAQATLGIFTFLHAWNDYLWPLISASKPEMYTLTLGLASTQSNFGQSEGIGYLMSQAVFAGLPVFILYLFFQKYIIAAVSGTTVK